jgi:hypothetical protein
MSKYAVRRTFLVRVVQDWTFETDRDLAAWLAEDPGEADQAVCDHGTFVDEESELIDKLIDYDELETYVEGVLA